MPKYFMNGMEFVRWEWVLAHTSPRHGHYDRDNYDAAKQDFAARSKSVNRRRLFSDEQLAEVYRCIWETLDVKYPITEERKKLLEEMAGLIEDAVPNLDELVELSNQKELEAEFDYGQTM